MTLAIATRDLTRTFDDFRAVDGIDLEVRGGTFFGFLGTNGAGKSTTIKMLTGLLAITSGQARVLGHDIAAEALEVKRNIGVVPDELALYDRLTGREYLTFVGRMYGLERAVVRERGDELLELMQLTAAPKKLVVDYSHGMQKKLALAAALIHAPRLLFLDEPFEGIDAISSRMIKDLLARLVQSGITVFLTSHILEIVEKLCTDVAIIHRGKLVAQGALDELRRGIELDGNGAGLRSLEEVFLEQVDVDRAPAGVLSWLGSLD
jgi:ABC-2 type transport system ATP-binding protein